LTHPVVFIAVCR